VETLATVGGRYAAFVWPAYGVSALVFAWMIIDTLARGHRARREVARLEAAAKTSPRP
jgi:heme exporter protein D